MQFLYDKMIILTDFIKVLLVLRRICHNLTKYKHTNIN